jgi:acetate kinase
MKSALPCILTINGGSSSIRFAVYEAGKTPRRRARWKDRSHRVERHEFYRQRSGWKTAGPAPAILMVKATKDRS